MALLVVGCSFRNTPIELREQLAFTGAGLARALDEFHVRYSCEVVILNTCNRVEIYLARSDSAAGLNAPLVAQVLADMHGVSAEAIIPHLYDYVGAAAVGHLLRVACGLDSLIVGDGQITGQVREAYEKTRAHACAGPVLNALFQHALRTAKSIRTQTGIARGRVSIASAAVDYIRQVFSHFADKTVLVIGAGKMSRLTLRHLLELHPKHILVTNRSPERAKTLAYDCAGQVVSWDQLDDALAVVDVVLSTTGAPEPIISWSRYQKILARRTKGTVVILDIAVPRDFDPRIHDGERTCLFNIDDLSRLCEQRLAERHRHVEAAEALVAEQTQIFLQEWARRRNGPVIAHLTRNLESKRQMVVQDLFAKLNNRLSEDDKRYIEGAFRSFQNQVLYDPLRALAEETTQNVPTAAGQTLLDALRKLFGLKESPAVAGCDLART